MSRPLSVAISLLLVLSLAACGKKAPPRWVEYVPFKAPENVSITYGPEGARLAWDFAEAGRKGFEGYVIYRDGGRGFREIGRSQSASYTDTKAEYGNVYTYMVSAWDASKSAVGKFSKSVTLLAHEAEEPPKDLNFEITLEGVVVSWTPAAIGLSHNVYKTVKREGDAGPIKTLVTGGAVEGNSLLDTHSPAQTVTYTIRAITNPESSGADGGRITIESQDSSALVVAPSDYVPSTPVGIKAFEARGTVVLVWKDNPEPWVKRYRVYRKEDDVFRMLGVSVTTAYTDYSPLQGRGLYIVTALGPETESDFSADVAVEVAAHAAPAQ